MKTKDIQDALVAWMVVTGFFQYTVWWQITHAAPVVPPSGKRLR